MKISRLILAFILISGPPLIYEDAQAETYFRAHDANSQIVGPFCIPELAGEEWYALDFDTAGLIITITTSASTTSFNYTGGNIDNVTTPGTWEDPAAAAIAVDQVVTGAHNGCVMLHLRDEVLAVANALDWAISFSDAGVLIMDHAGQIKATETVQDNRVEMDANSSQLAAIVADTGTDGVVLANDAITAAKIAVDALGASEVAADAIGASEIAANAIGPSEVANDAVDALAIATDAIDADAVAADAVDLYWNEVIETAGATYTGRCLLAALGAYIAGEFSTTGNTTTYQDTGGNLTRIVGTTTAMGRDTMSITCP